MAGTKPGAGSGQDGPRRLLAVAAALTYGVIALALVIAPVAAHATRSTPVLAATLVSGAVLLVGGGAALLSQGYAAPAAVALAAGGVWLASSLVGWLAGPVWPRAVALVLAAFLPALCLHLVLVVPRGTLSRPVRHRVLGVAYGATAAVTALTVLSRDPLRDPYCWHDCNLRALALLPDRQVAGAAAGAGRALVLVLALAVVVLAARHTVRGRRGDRPTVLVVWASALLGCGLAVGTLGVLLVPPERPSGTWWQVGHGIQVGGVLLLGVALVLIALRQQRRRAALRRLSEQVEAVPTVGSLEGHLARALGDPSLRVAHWLPESRRFVDSGGAPVHPDADGDRTRAELRRGEELLAVVTLDRRAADGDLGDQLGAATRLALDTERHHAEVLAQLEELRRSRERIVDAADTARRALERDLHDGVQAELVALLIEAGRALERARRSGDTEGVRMFTATVDRVSAAVARLRDITHGIYPAELAEDGLEAALWTLTDEARVPVQVDVALGSRPPRQVERAAYHVAVEAVGLTPGPDPLRLSVVGTGGKVHVRVAPMTIAAPIDLTDRVGALGGTLTWAGDTWEAVLPCAS